VFKIIPVLPVTCLCASMFRVCIRSLETDWHDSSTGAYAEVIDISDIASNQSDISIIDEDAFKAWTTGSSENRTTQELINSDPASSLAQLYYVLDDAGLVPVWDFRATANFTGVETATIMGFGSGSIPDVDPANIPWVYYTRLTGAIADEVYQIHTVGGVAPSSVSFWCITGAAAFDPVDDCVYVLLSLSIPSVH
jgi:hypothetical protein